MNTYLIYYILIMLLTFSATFLMIRGYIVMDFRHSWRMALKDEPDAQILFAKRVPSFKKMLWSFRKLKDSNWIPSDLRAARYRAELSPKAREALDTIAKMAKERREGGKS